MARLLVKKRKIQTALHDVSAGEEQRCILSEALSQRDGRKAALIEFLLEPEGVAPEAKLKFKRSRKIESQRKVKF